MPSPQMPAAPAEEDAPGTLAGLWGIVRHHLHTVRAPAPPPAPADPDALPTLSPTTRLLIRFVPWVLGFLFVLSFFWDFDGLAVVYADGALRFMVQGGETVAWHLGDLALPWGEGVLSLEGLLLVTSSSGLIGFLTNWIAITMLFRPRTRHPIFGQGVIPAQRDSIVVQLASAVNRELISTDVIQKGIHDSGIVQEFLAEAQRALRELLTDEAFREEIRSVIHRYVHEAISSEAFRQEIADFTMRRIADNLDSAVGGRALKAVVQLGQAPLRSAVDRIVREVPSGLEIVLSKLDAALDTLPDHVASHSAGLEAWASGAVQQFVGTQDIYSMLLGRMQEFDEQRLEDLIKHSSNEQFNYIKYLGGLLGFVGGLVIFERWLALPALGALLLLLIGLDYALIGALRRRKRRRHGNPA